MKKSLAMRVRETEITSSRITADRGSFQEHRWFHDGEERWYLDGRVACRSGLHVEVLSYWNGGVSMFAKWRGREYMLRRDDRCSSEESLRRAAVVFAERVIKRAGR